MFGVGGEVAALIARRDWSATPLGPIEQWPQSLLTTVGTMLGTRFPMFLFWGPEATCIYNDAYRPSLGADKHPAALGQPGQECWAEIWHIIGPQIAAVMSRGEQTWHSDQLVPFDRSGYFEEIYFTYSYSPVRDESGGVGGTLVVTAETTDRVIGERRVATLHRLAAPDGETPADVVRSLHDAIAAADADLAFGQLYRVAPDRSAAHLVWTTAPHVPGPEHVPLDDGGGGGIAPLLAQVARTGRPDESDDAEGIVGRVVAGAWPEELRQLAVLPVAVHGRELPDYLLVVGVSPRKQLDDAYRGFLDLLAGSVGRAVGDAEGRDEDRRRADELAALDRARAAFFSNVSHEFRTPLTLVLGPLEELLTNGGARSCEEQAQLESAYRNGLRLLRLVNDLLEFSRLEAGRARARRVPVDLARLTTALASNFRSALTAGGLEFEVVCPPLPRQVAVDPAMWETVVFNLVSNAFKFTLAGRVAVRLAMDGDDTVLSVSDTGIGIAAEEVPRLFERFHRVAGAPGRTHEGSGIGLALVDELVRLHGGSVGVESTPGVGSTFTVRVPADAGAGAGAGAAPETTPADDLAPAAGAGLIGGLAVADQLAAWLDDDQAPVRTARLAVVGPGTGTPAREQRAAHVLVVDDNADMRRYLARLLSPHWDVSLARDGRQALQLARERRPDIVVSDVMMPVLDGVGLLRVLRADPWLADVPVVLVSARSGPEAAVEALEAGADDYVVKPFTVLELVGRVRAVLSQASERAQHLRVVRRHLVRLETLARMTSRFTAATTVAQVADVVADELPRCLPASLARLHVPGATAPGATAPQATAPGTTAPGTTAPGTTAPNLGPVDDVLAELGGRAAGSGAPVLAGADLSEGGRAVADALRAAGCVAAAAVPVGGSGGWLAAAWLAVDGRPPALVDAEVVATLEAVAGAAAQTVERAGTAPAS